MKQKKISIIATIIFIIGIVLRIICLPVECNDHKLYLSDWWINIINNGKIDSIGMQIGNYMPSYMLFFTLATYITENSLVAIKCISIFFDIMLAIVTYFICKKIEVKNPLLISSIVFSLPGVILNSSFLGQCDAIYTCFCLIFMLMILKNKPKLACLFYGIALSFKLQAIFIAPIFLYLLVSKKIKIMDLIFAIVGFVLLCIPSMLMGKSILDIINIYIGQTSFKEVFSASCPNIYSLFSLNYTHINKIFSWTISILVILLTTFFVLMKKKEDKYVNYTDSEFVMKCTFLAVIVPFLLPQMMDRYFYLANILIIIYLIKQHGGSKIIFVASLSWFVAPLIWNLYDFELISTKIGEFIISTFCSLITLYIVWYLLNHIKYEKRYLINLKNNK